jgi:hypothetical protein
MHLGSIHSLPRHCSPKEAVLPRLIDLNKGSKRRINQIRWKPIEVITALLILLTVSILGIVLAIWSVLNHVN